MSLVDLEIAATRAAVALLRRALRDFEPDHDGAFNPTQRHARTIALLLDQLEADLLRLELDLIPDRPRIPF